MSAPGNRGSPSLEEAAIAEDRLDELDRLLSAPSARPDARVAGGCGLAQVAAHWGRLAHLRRLRRAGCPMQLPDNDGDTALTQAAACGHLGVVEFLLDEAGVDPDASNRAGCTALHAACERKHLAIVRLLLGRAARPDLLDEAGNSLLHALAARPPPPPMQQQQQVRQQPSVIKPQYQAEPSSIAELMLILVTSRGLQPDQENCRGYTALMKCVATGHWSLLPHLLPIGGRAFGQLASRHGVNLAHVFYAHHDDSDGARAAAGLLSRCLGRESWAALLATGATGGGYGGYACLHFACEFCRVGWLPGLLTAERTSRGESAVDILARRRQLGPLRQRCARAAPGVWRQLLLLLDPPLGAPGPVPSQARLARARRLLWPLCDNDEHDSGRLFLRQGGGGGGDISGSYESGRRYWQTGGQVGRQFPLALRLLVAAIGEDSPEAFASLLELGHLDGVWGVEFGRDLRQYLTSGGTSALPAVGNGLVQLRPEHLAAVDWLDPLELAVALGRSRIVQEMLLARPFDLIPSCLLVLLWCRRMRHVRHRCVGDMRDCANAVLVNALNGLHDGATSEKERRRIDAYVHGEFGAGPVFAESPLPVLRETELQPTECRPAVAAAGSTVLQLLLASGCDEALSTRCVRMLVKRRWAARARCSACGRGSLSPAGKFGLHTASLAVFTALLTAFLAAGGQSDRRYDAWQPTVLATLLAFTLDHLVLGCRVLRCGKRWWPHDFTGAWRGAELLLPTLMQLASLLGLAAVSAAGLDGSGALGYYLHLALAASYLLLSIRWLYILTVFRRTGPTVSILKTLIVDDLMPFLSIFMLITLAFGVFFHSALHPNGRQYRISDGQPVAMETIESLVEIYSRPLLLAFGEFQIDSLRPCERRSGNCSELAGTDCACPHQDGLRLYLSLFVHVYLFVNLALLNLLIAKFSLTVNTKVEQAFVIWNKHRMRMLCEYQILPSLPPPLSGLNLAFSSLFASSCLSCQEAFAKRPQSSTQPPTWSDWDSFVECKPYLKYLWLQACKFRNRRRLFLRRVKFGADGSVQYISQPA